MTSNSNSNSPTRTITLTDRRPVTIREDLWPVIAIARWWDGEIESQALRRQTIRVRQHDDGRAIVYAIHRSAYRGDVDRAAGEIVLPPRHDGPDGDGRLGFDADLVTAIRRVGESAGILDWMIDRCIADLPAEDLDVADVAEVAS